MRHLFAMTLLFTALLLGTTAHASNPKPEQWLYQDSPYDKINGKNLFQTTAIRNIANQLPSSTAGVIKKAKMSQDVILQSKVLYVWIWDKNETDTTVHLFYHIKNGKFWIYHQQQDNSIRCYANNLDDVINFDLANLDYIPTSQCKKV